MDREEAIRRIKAWNLDPDDREALFAVIPELKESQLTLEDIDTMALEHVKKLNPTLSELITKESLRASYYLRGEYDTYRQGLIDMYNKIKK